jgi:hypothetical protein
VEKKIEALLLLDILVKSKSERVDPQQCFIVGMADKGSQLGDDAR